MLLLFVTTGWYGITAEALWCCLLQTSRTDEGMYREVVHSNQACPAIVDAQQLNAHGICAFAARSTFLVL